MAGTFWPKAILRSHSIFRLSHLKSGEFFQEQKSFSLNLALMPPNTSLVWQNSRWVWERTEENSVSTADLSKATRFVFRKIFLGKDDLEDRVLIKETV